tara:strand:+ start:699 stop:1058 length:360 start_codon:yes stop_codon:yes gene_type:complete
MDNLMQCCVEPKQGLLTGEETSLDVILGNRVGHDIQGRILEFLDFIPDFLDDELQTSYIEFYDDLMNPEVFPVEQEELYCFQNNDIYDEDFIIGAEFCLKDGDDAFVKELYQDNCYKII